MACKGCIPSDGGELVGCPRCGAMCCGVDLEPCATCDGFSWSCMHACDAQGQHPGGRGGQVFSVGSIVIPSGERMAEVIAAAGGGDAELLAAVMAEYRRVNPGVPRQDLRDMAAVTLAIHQVGDDLG